MDMDSAPDVPPPTSSPEPGTPSALRQDLMPARKRMRPQMVMPAISTPSDSSDSDDEPDMPPQLGKRRRVSQANGSWQRARNRRDAEPVPGALEEVVSLARFRKRILADDPIRRSSRTMTFALYDVRRVRHGSRCGLLVIVCVGESIALQPNVGRHRPRASTHHPLQCSGSKLRPKP